MYPMATFMDLLEKELILGGLRISLMSVTTGLVLLILIWAVVRIIKRSLRERMLPRLGLNRGVSVAISTLTGYFLLLLGSLAIMPIMLPGFSLTSLSLALGAVSFGIGFGLRNIADNFVSGLILLIERPIKVGDRVEVGGLEGQVVDIRVRSTTVRTNDNINIIVPNSEFASTRVTNLSHNDNRVRYGITVGVHYNSDVHLVAKALLEAVEGCPDVLKLPKAAALFVGFGDSSLDFEVRVWTDTLYDRPSALRSQVNYQIWDAFKRYGIEIPYPQRDLYIKEFPTSATSSPVVES